jgi:hypothetical protein
MLRLKCQEPFPAVQPSGLQQLQPGQQVCGMGNLASISLNCAICCSPLAICFSASANVFEELTDESNPIRFPRPPDLTGQDLKDIGVSLGHRCQLHNFQSLLVFPSLVRLSARGVRQLRERRRPGCSKVPFKLLLNYHDSPFF